MAKPECADHEFIKEFAAGLNENGTKIRVRCDDCGTVIEEGESR